jgi:Rrf2 family protein
MKLSRTVLYAVGAVLQLGCSDPQAALSSCRLATDGGMPERFLLQILRQLVVHGVLRSQRGVFGGYVLARRLGDISLLDIIEAIEGPISAPLPAIPLLPEESLAILQMALSEVAEEKRNSLRRISLAQILPREWATTINQLDSSPVPVLDSSRQNVSLRTGMHNGLTQ